MTSTLRRGRLLRGSFAGAAVFLLSAAAQATPCNHSSDCDNGFCVDGVCCDSACTDPCHACSAAVKGQGEDGVCGLKAAGKICVPAHCDDSLSFIQDAFCDAAGNCLPPPPGVSCLTNDPCKFDLCSDTGCESATKLDGTDCGGGQVCLGGVCGAMTSSSSSSSSSTSSSSTSSSGTIGTGGAGGSGGSAAGGAASGGGSPYPPKLIDSGCGCRVGGDAGHGAAWIGALAVMGILRRRRRARSPSFGAPPRSM